MMADTLEAEPKKDIPGENFERVPRSEISIGGTNPRKSFPKAKLEELAASIRVHDVIQPLLCRPNPDLDGDQQTIPDTVARLELVSGERRWRAAGLIDRDFVVPVVIRDLSDTEVREIQLIENLQREDVSAFEEATGYAELLDLKDEDGTALYTIEKIATSIGQTQAYVGQRLKVCRAPKILLDALDQGRIGVRACEMIGRIPTKSDRDHAARRVLNPQYRPEGSVMTNKEIQEMLNEDYVIRLRTANFDPADVTLCPGAGACADCAHRSGNVAEFELELAVVPAGKKGKGKGIDPDMCLNPACFRSKEEATWLRIVDDEDGNVLSDSESKANFSSWDDGLIYDSKYIDLSEKPTWRDTHNGQEVRKIWRTLTKGGDLPTLKARNPHTGKIHEVALRKLAIDVAHKNFEAKGEDSPFKADRKSKEEEQARKKLAAERSRQEKMEAIVGLDLLAEKMSEQGLSREALFVVLEAQLCENTQVCKMFGGWLELKPDPRREGSMGGPYDIVPVIMDHIMNAERVFSEGDLLTFIGCASVAANLSWGGIETKFFARLAELYGLETKVFRSTAAERIRQIDLAKKAKGVPAKKKAVKRTSNAKHGTSNVEGGEA